MHPKRLRLWIRKYGDAGVALAGSCLVMYHLWTKRRAALMGSIAALCVSLVCLSLCLLHLRKQSRQSSLPAVKATAQHLPTLPHLQNNIRLRLLMGKGDDAYHSTLTASRGQQAVWQDTCEYGFVSAVDKTQTVYYDDGRGGLVARGYDGRVIWQRGGHYEFCRGVMDVCAGGNVALVEYDSGPSWGVGLCDPTIWHNAVSMYRVQAFDHHGKPVWEVGENAVGKPVWTNGNVFVDVRLDVSERAISRILDHNAKMPVWIELRRVETRQCLWKRQLAGCPQALSSIRVTPKGKLELVFKGREDSRTWVDFVPSATPTHLVVPVSIAHIDAGGSTGAMLEAHL